MEAVYSVGQANQYVKRMFQQDFFLNRISVRGEVSNCKYHNSGHIYFSLKDETGTLACVMFAGQRKGLAFAMKNGDRVIVGGSVDVYERDGKYQLYAREIRLEGAGLLYERYLALKDELEEMGMFAPEYKQPIPAYAKRIGIVTAPTGAAIQDIRKIAGRRNPYVQLILYPALVQGEGAKESIAEGIRVLDALALDVLIVGRGGGSIEDLWAFNEEIVARAIFDCRTPVISAVGHETDTTIADFAADLRAPTPSAAAELAVADIRGLWNTMEQYAGRMEQAVEHKLLLERKHLEQLQTRFSYLSPQNRLREARTRALGFEEQLNSRMEQLVTQRRHQLQLYLERLKGLSPLEKLNRGFAYVEDAKKQAVTSVCQLKPSDTICIQLKDGSVTAAVGEVTQLCR